MSSSNKTENLQLNSWLGSDIPSREDFNNDNSIIDGAVSEHVGDTVRHITDEEREKWNDKPYYFTMYVGDGKASRTISVGCPFNPMWGIIFPIDMPPSICDIGNEAHYHYTAFISQSGGSIGAGFDGNKLVVSSNPKPVMGYEYKNLNQNGVLYAGVLFK